eukprot:GHVS01044101.1.p1 GENE.GHVS01044101.1~~GHVS01044101.1.p1  ORF type:complete len:140 (+),score=39.79 GHVS01044101.1:32-421(+)
MSVSSPPSSSSSPSSPSPAASGGRYCLWPETPPVDRRKQIVEMFRLRVNNSNTRKLKNFLLADPVYWLLRLIDRERRQGSALPYMKTPESRRALLPAHLLLDFQGHSPFAHFDPLVNRKTMEHIMERTV